MCLEKHGLITLTWLASVRIGRKKALEETQTEKRNVFGHPERAKTSCSCNRFKAIMTNRIPGINNLTAEYTPLTRGFPECYTAV